MCKIVSLVVVFSLISSYVLGDNRIVGGVETPIENYKFAGSMLKTTLLGIHSLRCGVSFLKTRLALTAAHCCEGISPSAVTLRFGSNKYNSGGSTFKAVTLTKHPAYDSTTFENDVCIITVNKDIPTDATKQPVVLYDGTTEPVNKTTCQVVGFGHTSEGGQASSTLRVANVPYVDRTTCDSAYSGAIESSMICAGEEGKDSCQGDSGGPMMVDGKQLGVVSWGEGCARDGFPGVYSNLIHPAIRDWIVGYMASH